MNYQIFPSYHAAGPQLVIDLPTTPATSVTVCLTPALYTESKFPDSFAYSCVLHTSHNMDSTEFESYISEATDAIVDIVGFSAFPFASNKDKAMIAFYPKDVEHKKEGGNVVPFSIMLRPTKEVFLNAVTIIDMQAMAIDGARTAGVLQVPNAVESLLSSPTVSKVTH